MRSSLLIVSLFTISHSQQNQDALGIQKVTVLENDDDHDGFYTSK